MKRGPIERKIPYYCKCILPIEEHEGTSFKCKMGLYFVFYILYFVFELFLEEIEKRVFT